MAEFDFEWNENKDRANHLQAAQVFYDPRHLLTRDRVKDGEERWHATGRVDRELLLLVVHTLRGENGTEVIRIISARRAKKAERRAYETENG